MLFVVYALKDEKVGFKQPFFSNNEKEVEVSFSRLVNSKECPFPVEDTNLYKLGFYNDEDGSLESTQDEHGLCVPELVLKGADLLKKVESTNGDKD